MRTIRAYLPYTVIIATAALLSVGGLTLASHSDRVGDVTPFVVHCTEYAQTGQWNPDWFGHIEVCADLGRFYPTKP
jgi:hypothetical protein